MNQVNIHNIHNGQEADIQTTLGLDESSRHSSYRKRWWLAGGAALLLVIIAVLGWRLNYNNSSPHYQTRAAVRGDLLVTVTATGNLAPTDLVEVGVEVSGTVASVEADFNDRVKRGQVLAKLDTDQLQAKYQQSRASLALAKASVKDAEATVVEMRNKLKRAMEMRKQNLCSQEECDAAKAADARAEAALARANAQVDQAEAQVVADHTLLDKAVIRSPIDGVVLKRQVEAGQTLAASLQTPVLFTLARSLAKMELHVYVDEADVGQVKAGQAATFSVDAYPNRTFPAQISQVRYGSQQVEGVITYETVLNVDNSDLSLRPGMTATADIVVNKIHNALLVPNAALRFAPARPEQDKGGSGGLVRQILPHRPHNRQVRQDDNHDKQEQKVWVLQDGQPVAVPLVTGATDGVMSEVVSGEIKAGMPLIVEAITEKR